MKIDIERLKADIEAGTPGPWGAALERGCHGVIAHSLPEGGANFVALVGNDSETTEIEPARFANARRIASVPDMEARILSDADRIAALEAKLKTVDRGVWRIGAPDKISGSEWFIAKDKHGRRCVFRALPSDYSYNYEDGFGTYYSDPEIVAWMQFPDGHFLPPDTETESECPYAKIKALEAKVKAADELVDACDSCERVLSAVSDGRSVYETPIYNARQALTAYREVQS